MLASRAPDRKPPALLLSASSRQAHGKLTSTPAPLQPCPPPGHPSTPNASLSRLLAVHSPLRLPSIPRPMPPPRPPPRGHLPPWVLAPQPSRWPRPPEGRPQSLHIPSLTSSGAGHTAGTCRTPQPSPQDTPFHVEPALHTEGLRLICSLGLESDPSPTCQAGGPDGALEPRVQAAPFTPRGATHPGLRT